MKNVIKYMMAVALALVILPSSAFAQAMAFNAPTVSLSVTTSSSRVAYGALNTSSVIVKNAGTANIFCKSGNSTVTATTSDTLFMGGAIENYTKKSDDTYIACITSSGTATAYIQTGSGE